MNLKIEANEIAGNSYLGGYAAGLHLSGGDPYQGTLARIKRRIGLIISCVVWDGLGFFHGRASRFASFRCREGQLER